MAVPQPPPDPGLLIDRVADEFERFLRRGMRPQIEQYLRRVDSEHRGQLLATLLPLELEWCAGQGITLIPLQYYQRFPEHRDVVQSVLTAETSAVARETLRPAQATPAVPRVIPPAVPSQPQPPEQKQPAQPPAPPPVAPAPPPRQPEVLRFGKFRLLDKLGSGGFGTVYRAEDTLAGRTVALKLPHRLDDPDLRRRFITEVRSAAKLDHPGIVRVLESELVGQQLYVATQLIDGQDLSEVIRHQKPSLKQLVSWIRDAARALAYAHREGVIHRDVKPSNLLISRSGQLAVSDFGLARRVEDNSSLTSTGNILGTPRYMAPEQAAGLNKAVGPASDQYSLGVILYEVLTGRPPHQGKMPQLLTQIIRDEFPLPRDLNPKVPEALQTICVKALARNAAHRFPDLDQFADELDRWLQGEPITVTLQQPPTGLTALLQHRLVWMFGTAALLVVVIAVSLMTLGGAAAWRFAPRADAGKVVDQPAPAAPPAELPPGDLQPLPEQPGAAPGPRAQADPRQLLTLLQPGSSWNCPTLTADGRESPGLLTVIDLQPVNQQVQLLLSDPRQPDRKSIWTGRWQPVKDAAGELAWTIDATPLVGELRPSQQPPPRVLPLAVSAKGELIWQRQPQPWSLKSVPNPPPVPRKDELLAELFRASSRGQVWIGTLQAPGEAAQPVRLTFTEQRDEGQYLAAVLEAADDPFASAQFVGVVNTELPILLAGQPLQLKRTADLLETYAPRYLSPQLTLALVGGQLLGTLDQSRLQLRPQAVPQFPAGRRDAWEQLLQPGRIWEGVRKFQTEPPAAVRIIVAETREDYGFVRLVVEDPADPQLFSVFTGVLQNDGNQLDHFPLELNASVASISVRSALFPGRRLTKLWARATPAGDQIFLYSEAGERISLKPLPALFEQDLTTAGRRELWQATWTAGKSWMGTLLNREVHASTNLTFAVTGGPDELGRVTAAVWETSKPRARMLLEGTLDLTDDLSPLAYPLTLSKVRQGQGGSLLLGNSRTPGHLQLRLSPDGKRLIGAMSQQGEEGNWIEILVLDEQSND
jgi:hypothetical protein